MEKVIHLPLATVEELFAEGVTTGVLGVLVVVVDCTCQLCSYGLAASHCSLTRLNSCTAPRYELPSQEHGVSNLQVFFNTSGEQPISLASSSPVPNFLINPRPT
jgi:hypothetical protein